MRQTRICVIEDAAEGNGTVCRGKMAGSVGHIGCFSFYANKVITMGEGRAVVTNDEQLFAKFRYLQDQYFVPYKKFHHPKVGYNYRVSNMQAAVGLAQLKLEARRSVARKYKELLSDVKQLELPDEPTIPDSKNSLWMYPVKVFDGIRDKLKKFLDECSVVAREFFYPINRQSVYSNYGFQAPTAEKLSQSGLLLPTGRKLTENEQEYVACKIKEFFKVRR